ncbi:hypothetical protein IQ252_20240 [Tychonema sp. LEGE 07203]|nr:hypothetical protein [Tychonema sp. LEGE 07203]
MKIGIDITGHWDAGESKQYLLDCVHSIDESSKASKLAGKMPDSQLIEPV